MYMLRLWKWYQHSLAVHPVKTQVISSGLIWGFGDMAAQTITLSMAKRRPEVQDEDKELKINWKRVATTSCFGLGFVGPVGHFCFTFIPNNKECAIPKISQLSDQNDKHVRIFCYLCLVRLGWGYEVFIFIIIWYEGLDRYIRLRLRLQPNSFRFVATKVAVDGFIFGPLDLLVFFTYMGFSAGKSVPQIKEDVKRDFIPALMMEGGIWPVLQVVNFRFIPVRYQLLYVNFFCILDSCLLSWIEQQQDAPWKQWMKSFLSLKEKEGQEDG